MHEIYYTSAPQGVRPGQQGFCTVATSPAIPKPLWDRLESISGYRHPFGSAPTRSPVAWAHWLMDLGGREVSVLSRICDSGLDYTQRTNAFAHHLELEPEERAAGGPAWMLRQPGLMAQNWDGRVGTIPRSAPLPRGDAPPMPCSAWQRMAGDAGWAGVLAETVTKKPRRSAYIIFAAGQDLLPLMMEAIALLPPKLRWQATFSTYFTSAPGNVTCGWRCCLADSPAAAEAARRSAGSLVLDLTSPLGAPPAGTWVDAARAGRLGASDATSPPVHVKPARSVAVTTPPPIPLKPSTLKPAPAVFDPADLIELPPPPPPIGGQVLQVTQADASHAADVTWTGPSRMPRRTWVIGLSAAAISFIVVGTLLRLGAQRDRGTSASSDGRVPTTESTPSASSDPPAPMWPFGTTEPTTKQFASVIPVPPPSPPEPVVRPETRPKPTTAPVPVIAPILPPVAPVTAPTVDLTPEAFEFAQPVDMPVASGIKGPVQSLQWPDTASAGSFRLALPGEQNSYTVDSDELSGTLSAIQDRSHPHHVDVTWRDADNPGRSLKVAAIHLESGPRSNFEIHWTAATLLSRPAVVCLARSVLQSATIQTNSTRSARPVIIRFKRLPPVTIDIGAAKTAIAAPTIPATANIQSAGELPGGWRVDAQREWDANAPHNLATSGWALHFHGTSAASPSGRDFEVHIAPGWSAAQSNWAAQRDAIAASLASSADDAKRLAEQVQQQQAQQQMILAPFQKELDDAQAVARMNDEQLGSRFTNRADADKRLQAARVALFDHRVQLEQDLNVVQMKKGDAERVHAALRADVKAFDELNDADLVAELPGGVRAAVFRLVHKSIP